jgi:predicted ABC-type ATPase
MSVPRMRMIAGPNGSGKSTLLEYLRKQSFPLGFCQNPDELETQLERTHQLDFNAWGLDVEQGALTRFFQDHPLGTAEWNRNIAVDANVLRVKAVIAGGYFAAVLSDFIRQGWLGAKQTFTFETVMSSADKIKLLRQARQLGYRTYLYYICTNSATISLERIAVRVAQGGHGVPGEKVAQRYLRSLGLLPDAIAASNRTYLFDNSQASHSIVAEYQDGVLVSIAKNPPLWFVKYVLDAGAR